jgi:putative spermidine/putrescine transport system ATP-binding protein
MMAEMVNAVAETARQAPMVELRGVAKSFGDVDAVKSVDLTLAKGAFLTILGPSGCGKTTLLRMIAGFDRPTAGTIRIAGRPVDAVPPHRRTVGMVFQRLALFPHLTAAENVAYPLRMRRFPKADIARRVEATLDLVRLGGLGARRPHELSGGQQQRVAIARALSFGPDLLLLDEPLSALDKKLREEMQLEFRRIQQELGVTTINVTHDQREALVMSDRILVMNAGRVQQDGSPEEVYRAPANPFVATFIGMTATMTGSVLEAASGSARVRVGDADLRARASELLAPGTPVDLAIRAEGVRVGTTGDNVVEGTVEAAIFEGDRLALKVRVDALGASLYAFSHDPAALHEAGSPVTLAFAARDLYAFPRT